MAVLLVIATFAVFVLLDYLIGLGHEPAEAVATATPARSPSIASIPVPHLVGEPVWVGGYQLPAALHYHPGHTWARELGPDTVVVGIDDFAGKLVGPPDELTLPKPGSWLRQGAPGFRLEVDGRAADFRAPVEGEVVEVNTGLRERPGLAAEEPYGRGWILKLRAPDLARSFRNLLSGSLARHWMQDSGERLELQVMALSGSVLMDGGEPVPGFARHLPEEDWDLLVREFLLS